MAQGPSGDGGGKSSAGKAKRVGFLEERLGGSALVASMDEKNWEEDANTAITFHIVDAPVESADQPECFASFHPDYTHQHFGDEQKIKGYRGLKIDIWLHSLSLSAMVSTSFDAKARTGADDVTKILADTFPAGFCMTRDDFGEKIKLIQNVNPRKFGRLLKEWVVSRHEGENGKRRKTESSCSLFHYSHKGPDAMPAHMMKRLFEWTQPMALFFIDGASIVEYDENWEIVVLFEVDENSTARIAGFATFYNFYAFPDSSRMRISQVLVLPPFQRTGHASAILESLMGIAREGNYVDITVEDPTEDLQRVRDRVDLKALAETEEHGKPLTEAVQKALEHDLKAGKSGKHVPLALPKDVAESLRHNFKFCKPQIRRLWEMSLAKAAHSNGDAEREAGFWSVARRVRRRLYADNFLSSKRTAASENKLDPESRQALEELVTETMQGYNRTLQIS